MTSYLHVDGRMFNFQLMFTSSSESCFILAEVGEDWVHAYVTIKQHLDRFNWINH